jgi:hypothetical protein
MGNRIIEIEWAFKNDKEYVPSPKPSKKSKKKRRVKSYLGRENTAMDRDEGGGSDMRVVDRDGRSEAVVGFGMEITNTESPVGSKRTLADTGESTTTQTPPKRQKRMNNIIAKTTATPVVQVSSDDEYGELEARGVVKKERRMAVIV